MELVGFIISILAFLFAGFAYIKHDRKLKKQAELINEYQLENIYTKRENSKKANIEANVIKGDKGYRTIKIYNKGMAKAKNVKVGFPSAKDVGIFNNPCPIDILPQSSIEISIAANNNSPDKIILEFKWEDEFKKDNFNEQTIQI